MNKLSSVINFMIVFTHKILPLLFVIFKIVNGFIRYSLDLLNSHDYGTTIFAIKDVIMVGDSNVNSDNHGALGMSSKMFCHCGRKNTKLFCWYGSNSFIWSKKRKRKKETTHKHIYKKNRPNYKEK